jgi:deoxyribonuclease-4
MSSSQPLRIKEILDSLDTSSKAQLKKLLPKAASLKMPEADSVRFPPVLDKFLPKPDAHSILGMVAEELLRLPVVQITFDTMLESISSMYLELNGVPIQESKTIDAFLDCLRRVRGEMEKVLREPETDPLVYNKKLTFDCVQGQPDIMNKSQIFVFGTTTTLKPVWWELLFRTFAYAALEPEVKDVYILLPMQNTLWHYDIYTSGWKTRKECRDFLNAAAKKAANDAMQDSLVGELLRENYLIGRHIPKQKTLPDTILSLPNTRKPYQIFLGGPQNSSLRIPDEELAAAGRLIQEKKASLYVHSQYIINLCSSDGWNTELLMKNLQYAAAIGCKGVVVHVGKSTTRPIGEALETMKASVRKVLEAATESCPLLLETPAGQGTETLTGQSDFINFVLEIGSPRLRVCLDTCHVFACGHKPLDYIHGVYAAQPDLLKLIHYNDSAAPCGSCVDRHAFMGTGHIGMAGMKEIAEVCGSKRIPMLIE